MDMSRPPPLRHVGTEKTVVDDGAGMPGMAPPTDDGAGFFHPALEHPSLDMALDVEWDQMEMEEGAAAVDGDGWDYPPEPEEGGVVDDMDHEDPAGQDDDAQNETRELPVMDKLQWGHPVRIVGSMMTGPVQLHLCPQCDQVTCPSAATAVSIASAAAQPLTTPPPHCNCRAQFSLVITGYQQIRPDHRVQAHLLRLVRVQNPEPRGHVPTLRRISF
eukprot:m.131450 g.131450  ORF g.131450 m.131450 type:complete len:217 (+) comp13754_c0_seq2:340-990(+)